MSFGLEVYDENGKKVFDLGKHYLAQVGTIHIPPINSRFPKRTFALPQASGFKLWAMNSPMSDGWVSHISESEVVYHLYGYYVSGNVNHDTSYRTRDCYLMYGVYI